ncbi:hypothetical protein PsorP6_003707 [Peronosclerospora sorghi]|uniref:Uncharacterized protein n=1 Tax=Peronosclerospora sorghi TaxID=230839 RepID=A0ACC0VRK6_9STRA|nr:hypothetical protein PsorP6_003707 [Peronosclerospora sorghi]
MALTRELALPIEQEGIKLCKAIEYQGFLLPEGVDTIIGTPGRLMDWLESHYLVLNQCNYLVLDEADRMTDMVFEPQAVAVLENMGFMLKSKNED